MSDPTKSDRYANHEKLECFWKHCKTNRMTITSDIPIPVTSTWCQEAQKYSDEN